MKAVMEKWTEEQRKNTEKRIMSGNSEEAYNTLKALTKTKQHTSAVIKGSSVNILTESTAVLNQRTEYCSGLYSYKLHHDASPLQSNLTRTQEASCAEESG